jgi:hypothetical protein
MFGRSPSSPRSHSPPPLPPGLRACVPGPRGAQPAKRQPHHRRWCTTNLGSLIPHTPPRAPARYTIPPLNSSRCSYGMCELHNIDRHSQVGGAAAAPHPAARGLGRVQLSHLSLVTCSGCLHHRPVAGVGRSIRCSTARALTKPSPNVVEQRVCVSARLLYLHTPCVARPVFIDACMTFVRRP